MSVRVALLLLAVLARTDARVVTRASAAEAGAVGGQRAAAQPTYASGIMKAGERFASFFVGAQTPTGTASAGLSGL